MPPEKMRKLLLYGNTANELLSLVDHLALKGLIFFVATQKMIRQRSFWIATNLDFFISYFHEIIVKNDFE